MASASKARPAPSASPISRQGELGDVIYLDLEEGITVKAHESLGSIEAVKTVSDLFTPVGGKVLEAHSALNDCLKL